MRHRVLSAHLDVLFLVYGVSDPEDGGNMLIRNVGLCQSTRRHVPDSNITLEEYYLLGYTAVKYVIREPTFRGKKRRERNERESRWQAEQTSVDFERTARRYIFITTGGTTSNPTHCSSSSCLVTYKMFIA
jgi:hypothetical protein